MGKGRKTETIIMNDRFRLPEVIIQRIQSHLTSKEAAQTTILSKSWNKAWLTRPNLDYDEQDFIKEDGDEYYYNYDRGSTDALFNLANKTITRYEELKLKIESFGLGITGRLNNKKSDVATKLILKALKMGATNLSLDIGDNNFVLPHEVLGSENLVGLLVEGCKIELGTDHNVRCSRLESLSLSRLEVKENGLISNIISSCPLITNLTLSKIYLTRKEDFIDSREYEEDSDHQESGFESPIHLHNLNKLRCLVLISVYIDTSIFDDLSSKLPSLKDFTLKHCRLPEDLRISSRSLERLCFARGGAEDRYSDCERLRVVFDVPSIQKFTFVGGSSIPSVTFKSTSMEWESDLSITRNRLSILWFRKLNRFLKALRQSKISLSLEIRSRASFDYEVRDMPGLPRYEIENLTLDVEYLPSLSLHALFDGLFRLCRPRVITYNWQRESGSRWIAKTGFLIRTLEQGMKRKSSISSDFMYGLHDLEEVYVEIFEKRVEKWRSFPLMSLLEGSIKPQEEQKVRFHLKWKT